MDVDIRGVGRSGTTVMTQIVDMINGINTTNRGKVHSNKVNSSHVIITVRDFRDIVVSRWRTDLSHNNRHHIYNMRKMVKEEIDEILFPEGSMRSQMKDINSIKSEHLLILHYERFFRDFAWLFKQLESFLDIYIGNRSEIIRTCNIDANLEITKTQKHFGDFDQKTHYHGDHISPQKGRSVWREKIPAELHGYITEQLKDNLEKWEYD